MSVRTDYLNERLGRLLDRYNPLREWSDQAKADEAAALLRAIDRHAPRQDYDEWWPRFEDALAATLKSRSWPSVGDVERAVSGMPKPKTFAPVQTDGVDWRENGRRRQVKAWLDGQTHIPPHFVTWERLAAAGASGDEIEHALAVIASPDAQGIHGCNCQKCRRA